MSELKRSQIEFRQPAPSRRALCRDQPPLPPLQLATEAAELKLLEPWDNRAPEGGDPYNGIGSRVTLVVRTLGK